jgi:NADPH:quinone reductase
VTAPASSRATRVYGGLFPAGGGFAELALASGHKLAPMPDVSFQEAAGLVLAAATSYQGLVELGRRQAA